MIGQSSKDVMTSEPRTIDAGTSVAYAAKIMRDGALRIMAKHHVRDDKQTRALVEEISH